jgi:hypothetical protein
MEPSPKARALNAIVRDLMGTRDGATYFAGRVWGVHTHYDIGGEHRLVGRHVPSFQFEDGSTIGELMRDGRGTLLDFDGNPSLETLASEYGDQVRYASRQVAERLGLSAALIRPDGIVAWASDEDPNRGELQKEADRWFARQSATAQ